MNGPKLAIDWVHPGLKRRRELQALRKLIDKRATHWHWEWLNARSKGDTNKQHYANGMADAYAEVFNMLTKMRGYPWA